MSELDVHALGKPSKVTVVAPEYLFVDWTKSFEDCNSIKWTAQVGNVNSVRLANTLWSWM